MVKFNDAGQGRGARTLVPGQELADTEPEARPRPRRERPEERFRRMNQEEEALWSQGLLRVAGLDEAGRGPVAGPVAAAACILDPKRPIYGLNDSKKLSERRRELLYVEIKERSLAHAVALISAEEVDLLGINSAIQLAMDRCLEALGPVDFLLVDQGAFCFSQDFRCHVKGDAQINCIAAASILAKVSRDHYMIELDQRYPSYGFARHKGYGTPQHLRLIQELGPCPEHRRSFLQKYL